jgi:hypothetical protein
MVPPVAVTVSAKPVAHIREAGTTVTMQSTTAAKGGSIGGGKQQQQQQHKQVWIFVYVHACM